MYNTAIVVVYLSKMAKYPVEIEEPIMRLAQDIDERMKTRRIHLFDESRNLQQSQEDLKMAMDDGNLAIDISQKCEEYCHKIHFVSVDWNKDSIQQELEKCEMKVIRLILKDWSYLLPLQLEADFRQDLENLEKLMKQNSSKLLGKSEIEDLYTKIYTAVSQHFNQRYTDNDRPRGNKELLPWTPAVHTCYRRDKASQCALTANTRVKQAKFDIEMLKAKVSYLKTASKQKIVFPILITFSVVFIFLLIIWIVFITRPTIEENTDNLPITITKEPMEQ